MTALALLVALVLFWARSCARTLRIIPFPPKPGKMPSSQHQLEGECHGVTAFFLSAGLFCTHLVLCRLAPRLAQAPAAGSSGSLRRTHVREPVNAAVTG